MAIIKQRETQFGITASYYKIKRIECDSDRGEVLIWVDVYPNEECRTTSKTPITTEQIRIPFYRIEQDVRIPFYRLLEDLDWSPLYGGVPDKPVDSDLDFGIKEIVPPPTAPEPTLMSAQ